MSAIPAYILSALDQFGQPGFLPSTPGFRLMVAVRKALVQLNATLPDEPRSMTLEFRSGPEQLPLQKLNAAQLDRAATAFKAEISTDVTDEDLELLAERFVRAFLAAREGFQKGGFYDPTDAALRMMSKFSVTF